MQKLSAWIKLIKEHDSRSSRFLISMALIKLSSSFFIAKSDFVFVKVKIEQKLTCSTAKTKRVVSPAFIAMLLMVVVDVLDELCMNWDPFVFLPVQKI
ncbi:hypothetical protein T07_10404 [Trichinella nelsoni]|uniref:Uncharacterized protein n=1 Tax=Trichinella nelsoni TaxID=6336 RepID=A0A0V0S1C7_9BILA|nr:hypothetical protein T07_10404 [Trichinella nelsoni]